MQSPVQGYRLSPQQRRLWLLEREGTSCWAQCVLLIAGDLDPRQWEEAIRSVAARHEILRTTFRRAPGIKVPLQVLSEDQGLEWRLVASADSPAAEERATIDRLLAEEKRPFDFERGPLLRACLVGLGRERHACLLTLPALCADSQTLVLLAREIGDAYGARSTAAGDDLVQYVQYAEWQNELLEEPEAKEALLWAEAREVAGTPCLPFESPGQGGSARARHVLDLPGPLLTALKEQIEDQDASLLTALLTAWQILLWRLTDASPLRVHLGLDGRRHEELSKALGPFAKYLPIDCRFDRDDCFWELLRRVEQAAREALGWWDHYSPDRETRLSDFAVGFDFEVWPEVPPDGSGLLISFLQSAADSDSFKLHLVCSELPDGLRIELRHAADLFNREDVERLAERFHVLLARVVADPQEPVAFFDLLTSGEREAVLFQFNATACDFPRPLCLHELFVQQVVRTPAEVAVQFEGEELCYAELNRRANQLSHYLRKLGIGPEELVGVCLERSPSLIVALLAVLKTGGAYVALDPLLPPERLDFMLEDSRARVVLTEKRFLEGLPSSRAHAVCVDLEADVIAAESGAEPRPLGSPEGLAYVIYTSGSTGRPKGVMVPHRGLVNYLSWCCKAYGVSEGEGSLVHSPVSFDLTVTALFAPLLSGRRVVLVAEDRGIEGLSEALASQAEFSLVKLTPSHLEILSELLPKQRATGATRVLVVGGEALYAEPLAYWRRHAPETRLINEYGPTETVVGCIAYEVPQKSSLGSGRVPIGRPIANTRVYLLDERLQPVVPGGAGELYVGGEGVTRGYLHHAGDTAQRFLPDPWTDESGARMYRTGDRARLRPDGELEYLGRLDNQVKIRGFRVEPGEVEAVLVEHPAVREAAVAVRKDPSGEQRLVGYVVTESLAVSALRAFLREKLPDYMIPSILVPIPALPLTPNGKVDYQSLPAPDPVRSEVRAPYVSPRTAIEEILAAIWPKVLGVDRVGIDDNFFALGGDSIRSVRAVALAKERGLRSTVEQLFEHQTIRELAREIGTLEPGAIPAVRTRPFGLISEQDRQLVPPDVEDAYPLSNVQAGMLYHMQLDPDNPAYHNVNTWHLQTPFDWPTFLSAVERVVARHPALRTSFDLTRYSEPLQLVHEQAILPVLLEDLRGLTLSQQREALESFWQREQRNVFDLAEPPYLRFHLHRRSEETFQFTLVELHAILDGWSTTSTLAEIFELYLTLLARKTPRLGPPLATSFRDFILMERQALASEEHQRFWANRLSGASPTRLPRWPGYPQSPRARYEKLYLDIPPAVAEQVRAVANSAAVPFKSALLAAHVKALSVASGRDDILTGLVTNGRLEQLDGERVRGLFLNTLPFRHLVADGTWSDLVRRVFDAEREILPFRRYPIAALQAKWGRQPLFEVAFTFLNFHSVQGLLQSGEITILQDDERDFSFANFTLNLTFFLSPISSNLRLIMEYDAHQLAPEQMAGLQQFYLRALTAMGEDPLAPHDAQSLLSAVERDQLLAGWNDTGEDLALLPLPHRFAEQAERTPEAIAVGGADLTYRDLDRWSNRLAHRLRALGVRPEVVVAIFLERSPEMLAATLGVLKAGGAYLPLDRDWPQARRSFVLADAAPAVAISTRALSQELGEFSGGLLRLDDGEELAGMAESLPAVAIDPENLAYVIYTSGSTGQPKGTLLTHCGLSNYLAWCVREYEVEAGEGALVHSSLAFDLTITGLFAPLLAGRRVDLVSETDRMGGLAEALLRSRDLSLVKLTPAQLDLLSRQIPAGEAAGRTRSFILGGESLTGEALRFWQELAPDTALINEYGPTEAVVGCVTYRVPRGTRLTGAVPIGTPIANCRAYVLDRRLQPVPVGAAGELFLAGPGLARGYLERPEFTARVFIPDPFTREAGGRLYRTGDQAMRLPDGTLEFLGRSDSQVKLRGFRIELEEVKVTLSRHPAVREAVAVVREDEGTARLVAYVVPQPGVEKPQVEDLRLFLKQRMPEPMVPSAFILLDTLPLTASGKVDRRALPAPGPERPDLAAAYRAPQSDLEAAIAGVWRDVLRVERVGIRDSFFDLGGDSLRLFQAYTKLRVALARDFPMIELLRYPTIESLALYLGQEQDTAKGAVESEMRLGLFAAGRDRLAHQRELMRRLGR